VTLNKKLSIHLSARMSIMIGMMLVLGFTGMQKLSAEETAAQEETLSAASAQVQTFGLLAAALAFSAAAIGAGIAISHVGAAAMGAIGEKPEIAGQALIFIALAEGIVVFGFITALMILGKV